MSPMVLVGTEPQSVGALVPGVVPVKEGTSGCFHARSTSWPDLDQPFGVGVWGEHGNLPCFSGLFSLQADGWEASQGVRGGSPLCFTTQARDLAQGVGSYLSGLGKKDAWESNAPWGLSTKFFTMG